MQVGGGDAKKSEAAAAEISGLRGGERQAVPTQSASGGQQGCTIVDNVCTTTCQLRDTWESQDDCQDCSSLSLAGNASRHKKVRAKLRELHEVQAQPATGGR